MSLDINNDSFWANRYGPIQPTGLLTEEQKKQIKDYIQKIEEKYPEEERTAINPKHYDLFPEHGIQVRELMQVLCDKLDRQGFSGFLCSDYVQAMQYFLRWFEKNGVEDIEKGIFYMNKIIQQVQEMEKL